MATATDTENYSGSLLVPKKAFMLGLVVFLSVLVSSLCGPVDTSTIPTATNAASSAGATAVIEDNVPPSHRAKQFCYYFIRAIEDKVLLYLDILEGKPNPNTKVSSLPGKASAGAAGAIPLVGKGASIVTQEADRFILSKLVKKDAKVLADFVYLYRDDKETLRKLVVEAGLEIFTAFEMQFMEVTADGGQVRAMQKLANDAAFRMIRYFLEISSENNFSKEVIIKAVLHGISDRKLFELSAKGRTMKTQNNTVWKSGRIFTRVGICLIDEEGKKSYFQRDMTNTEKYGHRLKFSFEDEETIRELWEADESQLNYDYQLVDMDFNDLLVDTWLYIVKQDPFAAAKYDRELRHRKAMEDREEKHEEAMDDRDMKHFQAKQDRTKNYEKTIDYLTELHEAAKAGTVGQFVEAMKQRKDNLEYIISQMTNYSAISARDRQDHKVAIIGEIGGIKVDLNAAKNEILETGIRFNNETAHIIKDITDIKSEIDSDGAIVIRINKTEISNHPDVKNVRKAIKKVDEVLVQNDPSHKIKEEAKRIGDQFSRVFGW